MQIKMSEPVFVLEPPPNGWVQAEVSDCQASILPLTHHHHYTVRWETALKEIVSRNSESRAGVSFVQGSCSFGSASQSKWVPWGVLVTGNIGEMWMVSEMQLSRPA